MAQLDDLRNVIDNVLLSQYGEAPRMKALMEAFASTVDQEFLSPLQRIEKFPDPVQMSGYALDLLGSLIDIGRPFISFAGSDTPYFGFSGAVGYSPGGFGTLIADEETIRDAIAPINDRVYRRLLIARLQFLISPATYTAIVNIIQGIEPPGTVNNNRLVIRNGKRRFRINFKVQDRGLRKALENVELVRKIIPLPIPSNLQIRFIDE